MRCVATRKSSDTISVFHLQIFLPVLLPIKQTEQCVSRKIYKSNVDSKTIRN